MGNNNDIRIVLGSLRYKSAPDTDISLKVPLILNSKEIIEFDRTIDVGLEQVFYDERQSSQLFRPTSKFQVIFKNSYSGFTNYPPFENNLYYLDSLNNAKNQCDPNLGPDAVSWVGLPQYNEFDFIRSDYNVPGYTQPPNQHIVFEPESATTYNWNFYMTYDFSSTTAQTMQVIFQDNPSSVFSWTCGDGLPFIIQNKVMNGTKMICFKCPMKHGLSVGEFVKLSFSYNSQNIFQVDSLGLEEFGNEEFVFNIYDLGYTGTTFSDLTTGTFKRVLDENNVDDTISEYYVKKHKILTDVNEAILVNAGFEKNIFGVKKKYESSGLTPNNVARVSIKENSQSYTLTFENDIDISGLRDSQNRPITEIYFSVIWKGYFGWTFGEIDSGGGGIQGLQKGWEFNLPLDPNPGLTYPAPNPWWNNSNNLSDTGFPLDSYYTNPNPNQPINGFTYVKSLNVGDVIDGDYCEWNSLEQNERIVSNHYHKFKFNPFVFNTGEPIQNLTNRFGYYYQPHHPITLRVYSNYVENGDPTNVVGIPDYAHFSTTYNQFIWRDIYDYGYIDSDGRGVSYPFLNGRHYPFKNMIFRIIPEGTNYIEQNIILTPLVDNCE